MGEETVASIPCDETLRDWLCNQYAKLEAEHDIEVRNNLDGVSDNELDWSDTFVTPDTDRWTLNEYYNDGGVAIDYIRIRRFSLDEDGKKRYFINNFQSVLAKVTTRNDYLTDDEADEDGIYPYQFVHIFNRIQVCSPYLHKLCNSSDYNTSYLLDRLYAYADSREEKLYALEHYDDFRTFVAIKAMTKACENAENRDFVYPCVNVNIADINIVTAFVAAGYADLMKLENYDEFSDMLSFIYNSVTHQLKPNPEIEAEAAKISVTAKPILISPLNFNPTIKMSYNVTTSKLNTSVHVTRYNNVVTVNLGNTTLDGDQQNILTIGKDLALHACAIQQWIHRDVAPHSEVWWEFDINQYYCMNAVLGYDGVVRDRGTPITSLDELGFQNNILTLYPKEWLD